MSYNAKGWAWWAGSIFFAIIMLTDKGIPISMFALLCNQLFLYVAIYYWWGDLKQRKAESQRLDDTIRRLRGY